jgi:uncharacterized phage protein (TIGR01671 family)
MRELKFRAWLKNVKVMEYPKSNHNLFMWYEAEHQPIVVMQYTGLKDKNGTEIYEGDILACGHAEDEDEPVIVVFEDGAFRKQYKNWDETLPKPMLLKGEIALLEYKVIGNIYENPELLND